MSLSRPNAKPRPHTRDTGEPSRIKNGRPRTHIYPPSEEPGSTSANVELMNTRERAPIPRRRSAPCRRRHARCQPDRATSPASRTNGNKRGTCALCIAAIQTSFVPNLVADARRLRSTSCRLLAPGSNTYRDDFKLVLRRDSAHPNDLCQADHTELDMMILDEIEHATSLAEAEKVQNEGSWQLKIGGRRESQSCLAKAENYRRAFYSYRVLI